MFKDYDPSTLPPKIQELMSRPLPDDKDFHPDKQRVSSRQLEEDLSYEQGTQLGHRKVHVEHREDPMEDLRAPLSQYDDRSFFYLGLLYGYCRLDASITERYRAESGNDIDTRLHTVQHPLVEIAGFEKFSSTHVAHLIQSVHKDHMSALFDYISSQIIVDRVKNRVWKVQALPVSKFPDPYLLDAKEGAVSTEVLIFCPSNTDGWFAPEPNTSMFPKTPVVRYHEYDAEVKERNRKELERYLGKE